MEIQVMIRTKDRILYYILALLILISSIVTLLTDPKEDKTTKNQKPADTAVNYTINSTPMKRHKQGSIDSH
jgi:hypothetical protein